MSAQLIDGRQEAAALRADVTETVAAMAREGIVPGLAVVLVGDDPASQVYVKSKARLSEKAGFLSEVHRLSDDTSEAQLLDLVHRLNADERIDGILVQLPLPAHIESHRIIRAIDPMKDVDGFHPINVGALSASGSGFVPCTPLGCLMLIKRVVSDLSGLNAVVIGRSNIVGRPMAQLLLHENATVSILHSRTRQPETIAARADVLVAAIGRPKAIGADWIKPGAVVIDVGINRVHASDNKSILVGDVDFDAAMAVAGAVTPVPGGVGPMTIACLLSNTVRAARMRRQGTRP